MEKKQKEVFINQLKSFQLQLTEQINTLNKFSDDIEKDSILNDMFTKPIIIGTNRGILDVKFNYDRLMEHVGKELKE